MMSRFSRCCSSNCCCKCLLYNSDAEGVEQTEKMPADKYHKVPQDEGGGDSAHEVILPQYEKVPLDKLFYFQQPQVPIFMHPQLDLSYCAIDGDRTAYCPEPQTVAADKLRFTVSVPFHPSTTFDFHSITEEPLVKEPRIDFVLYYDIQTFALSVTIVRCIHLPAKDRGGTSDPFVTLFLLPHRESIFRSQTIYKNLDPIFNETFMFQNIPLEDIRTRTLVMRVFDEDMFSRNDLIGIVRIPLNRTELYGTQISAVLTQADKQDIDSDNDDGSGDIQLSLWYNPNMRVLSGLLLKGIHLKKMDFIGLSDPYVKLKLLHKGVKIGKWKSKIVKKSLSPEFNEDFTFDIADMNIEDITLKLVLKDKDIFSKDDVMGHMEFGSTVAHKSGCDHWKEMIQNPFTRTTHWHTLNS